MPFFCNAVELCIPATVSCGSAMFADAIALSCHAVSVLWRVVAPRRLCAISLPLCYAIGCESPGAAASKAPNPKHLQYRRRDTTQLARTSHMLHLCECCGKVVLLLCYCYVIASCRLLSATPSMHSNTMHNQKLAWQTSLRPRQRQLTRFVVAVRHAAATSNKQIRPQKQKRRANALEILQGKASNSLTKAMLSHEFLAAGGTRESA